MEFCKHIVTSVVQLKHENKPITGHRIQRKGQTAPLMSKDSGIIFHSDWSIAGWIAHLNKIIC